MTLCGVAMMSVVTMAQQTDSTSIQNSNSDQNTELRNSDGSNQATQGQAETQDQSASPAPTTGQDATNQSGQSGQTGQTGSEATETQSQTGQTGTSSEGTEKSRKKSKKENP